MPKNRSKKTNDESGVILLLHGKSLSVVHYMKELFASIGLLAATVLDLPSKTKSREDRVRHYIKTCSLPIAIATFDEENEGNPNARADVIDEIARCRELKRNDLIVLRETKQNKPVGLQGNTVEKIVTIQFDMNSIHLLVPPLLKEISSRGLLSNIPQGSGSHVLGSIFNRFMDSMNLLWDKEFDEAWDMVHKKDYVAERQINLQMDKFHQKYIEPLKSLVSEEANSDDLQNECDKAYEESLALVAAAWENAVDGMIRTIDENGGDKQSSTHRDIDKKHFKAKKERNNMTKIALLREVAGLADKVLNG